jgi:hypothetical protein
MSNVSSLSRSIDTMVEITDIAPATLIAAATRVAASTAQEHFVYRESEMDELWRLADMDLRKARQASPHSAETKRLERLAGLIHRAHDVLGQDSDTKTAAALLREASSV